MTIVSILAVLSFSTVLCIIEIPKMLNGRLFKELWAFLILLGSGTVLAILKGLNVEIPNPSDWIAWVYSPFRKVMESLIK